MKQILGTVLGVFAVASLFAVVVPAAAQEVPLGSITYEARPQRDVIDVGGQGIQFRAIRLEVRQSDVEISDVTVIYGNGTREDLKLRQRFRAGSSSREIALSGGGRNIRQIIVTYQAERPARILFFGIRGSGGGGDTASWTRLSCKEVSFLIDKDTVKVGRGEGIFRAIRLKARRAPIEMFNVRVVFGNGVKQDINVRSVIPDGGETRPLDLAGANRGVDRVELIYRAIPTFKGKAELCVDGLLR